jgi:hypothetical protein
LLLAVGYMSVAVGYMNVAVGYMYFYQSRISGTLNLNQSCSYYRISLAYLQAGFL